MPNWQTAPSVMDYTDVLTQGYGNSRVLAMWLPQSRLTKLNGSEYRQHTNNNTAISFRMASQITSLPIVYSTVYSCADQRKHQSSASLVFVRGILRWPVNFPQKGPVTRKMLPYDDVIMIISLHSGGKFVHVVLGAPCRLTRHNCFFGCMHSQNPWSSYIYPGVIHTKKSVGEIRDNFICVSIYDQLHWLEDLNYALRSDVMTSSNGNIFRVTGHLCKEFTGTRGIPHTKASDAELWFLLWSAPE